MYKAAGFSGSRILLKSEGAFNGCKKFHDMDISKSIVDNLSGKNIVEHPIFIIILNHHSSGFNIDESSDEENGEEKTAEKVQERNKSLMDKTISNTIATPTIPSGSSSKNENSESLLGFW